MDKTYYIHYIDEGKKCSYPLDLNNAIEYLKICKVYKENVDVQEQINELNANCKL